jgi:hypothetical protein
VSDPDKPCDLCALPVGVRPFALQTPDGGLAFCCEGCRGIYQMLNDIEDNPVDMRDNATANS